MPVMFPTELVNMQLKAILEQLLLNWDLMGLLLM